MKLAFKPSILSFNFIILFNNRSVKTSPSLSNYLLRGPECIKHYLEYFWGHHTQKQEN